MSFCVNATAKALQVTAGWGQYERTDSQTLTKKDDTPCVRNTHPLLDQPPCIGQRVMLVCLAQKPHVNGEISILTGRCLCQRYYLGNLRFSTKESL